MVYDFSIGVKAAVQEKKRTISRSTAKHDNREYS